jgi:hypothetical protein
VVVDGWPIDLVRIVNETILYAPLHVSAKRTPVENLRREGLDGLLAWRDEAPFDMEWEES